MTIVNKLSLSQLTRICTRGRLRRVGVGMLAGGALAFAGAGHCAAAPSDALPDLNDLPGIVAGIPNSSSDMGLGDLLPSLQSLIPGTGAQTGTSRCTSVIQVGDSTSVRADDPAFVPAAGDTASAEYRRVGVNSFTLDAVSGRAIVGGPSPDAEHAVASRLASGARGCWVIAMGVNDVGDISTGSSIDAGARIDRIMRQLSGQPVLWPTVTSSNPSNKAFDSAAMATFNTALRNATARYANLAVVDWAGAAQPAEFTDGIHYTAAGTADRNKRFADALAAAYPSGSVGASPSTRWVAG
ncbi:SGNH/GDSL hydrolase family protein [Gordonia sp. L191]|uniref:SGNH/GDSL hydrolase family protein n=1 Tax=Gordonia sp. L191 TaxID=2982699 RepID=UPI0024BF73B9|nr:SGNH/GDSL hydrolase family protein [Gordonia sp. L191]WHU48945.1 SGNH/GDSL hydrolase family protein [Gordonia sp. L191]